VLVSYAVSAPLPFPNIDEQSLKQMNLISQSLSFSFTPFSSIPFFLKYFFYIRREEAPLWPT
jgi:hypothetical protein